MFNAFNFQWTANAAVNTTVTYNMVSAFLCPSENLKARPAFPCGATPSSYAANKGGPGILHMWSGTIVEFYTCGIATSAAPNGLDRRWNLLVGSRRESGRLRLRERDRRHLEHRAV